MMRRHAFIAAANRPIAEELLPLERRLGPVEYRPIRSLAAYEKNPRRHPEQQLVKLMASISEFGFALPALVDNEGVIIVGHGRIEAARRLGMTEVPVLVAHHWTKAQVRAYRLADNRLAELASWDHELLAIELAALIEVDESPIEVLGWETGEIELIIEGETNDGASADPADRITELPRVPVTRPGDLWQLGRHRLLCASSLERNAWERLMQGQLGAMALTDPP